LEVCIVPVMTGSRFFAEALRGYGVTHVFFVPAILPDAMAAMDDTGVTRILTHGETAAGCMADGYARASGKPGGVKYTESANSTSAQV
jgi:acetolactate synthase I/II/III large subunit